MTLQEAIAACVRLTQGRSSTFYLGTRFMERARRDAVLAVYAACRTGDDAVDEIADPADGAAALDAWWHGIERAFDGRPRAEAPFEVALAWAVATYPVPRDAFEELHLGLRGDLGTVDVADTDELMLYCRRVAGVVGLLVAPVLGYRGGDDTLARAVALGQAMQLTNVLRDVGEDLRRGRCYLPRTLRERHGVQMADLERGAVRDGYVALLQELGAHAHALYRDGWRGIPRLHGVSRLAVGVAALNYEGILHKLRQNRYDNLTRRAYLHPLERLALIPRALVGVTAGQA